MAALSTQEIARRVGGELIGEDRSISTVGTLSEGGAEAIGFLAEEKYREQLTHSRLGAVVVSQAGETTATQIVVADVRRAWRIICEYFAAVREAAQPLGVHPQAVVDETAVLGADVRIGAGAVIAAGAQIGAKATIEALAYIGAGVVIGESTRIGPGAKILSGTTIGARGNILANAVIGERGFGNHFEDGRWLALPQLGGVRIGDDVEVGAGTMIDRGAIGDTVIGNGVKLDNLIQIAHNVEIGDHTAIAGCCVIAGSVKFGKYCVVGGATVFAGHITICDGAQFTGHSSISKSITTPGWYSSAMPVMPSREWKRFLAKLKLFGKEK